MLLKICKEDNIMNAKTCKQCGELKPIEQFRKYYGGRKGTYTTCKTCEKINSRAKYLTNKGDKCSEAELTELAKIHELWEVQRAAGLQPPRENAGRTVPLSESLDDMIGKYKQQAEAVQEVVQAVSAPEIPAELSKWLTEPLTEEPEYYQDEIYEQLKTKYRPKTKIDQDTMLPVYDDTYKPILDKILERFDNYEDTYYNSEED
jgi:hypothetical protein